MSPFLVVGALVAFFAVVEIATRKPASPPPKKVPAAIPPSSAPPQAPAPQLSFQGGFHPSPLYLWILQDGGSWQGVGWYYGHAGEVRPLAYESSRSVWFTPEYEVKQVLDMLKAEGISGYFDTIEPAGNEDRNFKGRIETAEDTRGLWFWVEAQFDEPAHYIAEAAHSFTAYV